MSTEQLRLLAGYYRELLNNISAKTGQHLIDLGATLRQGLTTDLGVFINDFQDILENDEISFKVERVSPDIISNNIAKSDEDKESNENNERYIKEEVDAEKRTASSRLIAIYRKQEQDRFNRETTIGFPIVAGKSGNKKFCAPLFYITVQVHYDPLESEISLVKNYETPAFNFNLIAKLVNSEEEAEIVRKKILPLIHEEDFSWEIVDKAISMCAELVDGFKGLTKDINTHISLKKPLEARENKHPKVFYAISIVNSARSNAFLVDELLKLSELEDLEGDTVMNTILSDVPEGISKDIEDPDDASYSRPLLFPLQSNLAQKRAARKAENARLMVIHGPPGTGKSQTIANIICDLVSQGNTVLMASHQNKALEVVEEKLPEIDYLAMSLLKGEKASVKRLANQLRFFDNYVSGVSLSRLREGYKNTENSIITKEKETRNLKTRFSELKTLERSNFPYYYKFNELKDYNYIYSDDLIKEGEEEQISNKLNEWYNLLIKIRGHYKELNNFFNIDNQDSSKIVSVLTELKNIFNTVFELGNSSYIQDLTKILEKREVNYQDSLRYLQDISGWLSNYGREYIYEIEKLRKNEVNVPSIQEGKSFQMAFEEEIWERLLEDVKNFNDKVKEILDIDYSFNKLPQMPKIDTINLINETVYKLENTGWLKWFISPQCIFARKELKKQGVYDLTYRTKKQELDLLKNWVRFWKIKYELIELNKKLKEFNIPIDDIHASSSVANISRQASIAMSYFYLLDMIGNLPYTAPEGLVNYSISLLDSLLSIEDFYKLEDIFKEGHTYINCLIRLQNVEEQCKINSKLTYVFITIRDSVKYLDFNRQVNEFVEHIENLIYMHSDFKEFLTLESTLLQNLTKTIPMLREQLINYREPQWLENIEKAIEAYRLNKFIEKDLVENPDDTSEVALGIGEINKQKKDEIKKALSLQRKIALKKASNDPEVKQQVMKLNKILQRKRKTASLVQLKENVIFEKLLNVFPCWIMNIEDVARIFPLQAGLFDYLIVDEASQCNQATTLHLAYRAKRMIVVGDEKQMKNPNIRFLPDDHVKMLMNKYKLSEHPKAIFLHGRESLLALSNYSSNCSEFLNEHFRCEPPIIAWSNNNFYDDNLRILTPIRPKRFKPCMEVHLVKGADDDPEKKQNIIEAEVAVNEAIRLITSGEAEGLSIGIMTLYREQANLLQSLLYEKIEENPEWKMNYDLIASTADGFQGDERDIIIYSFRFGPSSSPGVINAIQLEPERINVAFSRARRKLICFISRPVEEFPKGIIKDFLKHAEMEQKNPLDRLGLLNEDNFDSEFEKHVCYDFRHRGLTVYTQVPCSSFYIDMVVIDQEGRCMAVECDGDFHYEEDGELRPEDYQRQDIIERSGWYVHRIPARRYYFNQKSTIDKALNELMNQPVPDIKDNGDTGDENTDRNTQYENEMKKNSEEQGSELFEIVTNEEYQTVKQQSASINGDMQIQENPDTTSKEKLKDSNKKDDEKKNNLKKKKTRNKGESGEKSTNNEKLEPIWDPYVWFSLSHWSKNTGCFSGRYNSFCYKMGIYLKNGYNLTSKQENLAKNLWNEAVKNGFTPDAYQR